MPDWLRLRGIGCATCIPLRPRHDYSRPGDIERYRAYSLLFRDSPLNFRLFPQLPTKRSPNENAVADVPSSIVISIHLIC